MTNKNNSKIWSYFIILIALFIIVLVIKNQIFDIQANLDQKTEQTKKLKDLKDEVKKMGELKEKLEKDKDSEVNKYLENIKEDEIIDYIYREVENINLNQDGDRNQIKIKNISISKWEKNELWFLESNISLNLWVESENKLKKLLDFFNDKNSKYKFFISSFSMPKYTNKIEDEDAIKTEMDITIPLKIFYK